MTPQLEAAIAAIQPLSPAERQQLLNILIQGETSSVAVANLQDMSTQFWQGNTLEQLISAQSPTTVRNVEELTASFWTEEDSDVDPPLTKVQGILRGCYEAG
jgi:hypothetical protein